MSRPEKTSGHLPTSILHTQQRYSQGLSPPKLGTPSKRCWSTFNFPSPRLLLYSPYARLSTPWEGRSCADSPSSEPGQCLADGRSSSKCSKNGYVNDVFQNRSSTDKGLGSGGNRHLPEEEMEGQTGKSLALNTHTWPSPTA